MVLEKDVDITNLNGLRINSKASYLSKISSLDDLKETTNFAQKESLLMLPMGHGTNTIWGKDYIDKLIAEIKIPGFEIIKENSEETFIKIGAGEDWDKCVERAVDLNLSGIEALSAIPGTAGATPVQNVGAYGTEISETLYSLSAYDVVDKREVEILNNDCCFEYRNSIFKNKARNKLIITSITLRLSKSRPTIPNYKDVSAYFTKIGINNPNLQEIRNAIIQIRNRKLPNPKVIPNCGSFFKSPILTKEEAILIINKFPNIPYYTDSTNIKFPAGWLIESAGLKGHSFGHIVISPNHSLVLTSPEGMASPDELMQAVEEIRGIIRSKFNIELEIEPGIIY